jgi:tRNA A-37 threonylcarbamoyl transferase component Bud32
VGKKMELLKVRQEIVTQLKGDIPELVDKFNHFILTPFESKKNNVVKLTFNKTTERYPKEIVIKIFRTKNFETEYKTIVRLLKQDLKIPRILFHKNPFLILEKIEGINLCDFINDNLKGIEELDDVNSNQKQQLHLSIENLADWLVKLHQKNIIEQDDNIVLNKGDTRLRDFIYNPSNNNIYGVDFEESYEGNHIDDIAWVCCSLLDTDPGIFEMFNPRPKIDLINVFLKQYYQLNPSFQFDFNYFTERLIENLNIVMKRRQIHLNLSKENFLKEISKEL